MGYKLYREILEYAPWDWTRGERWVAAVIADDARDSTRRSWIPLDELCIRTGYTPNGVRRVLQRLAARGFEFRVSHGTGKDGREVFAARSHRVDYLVPHMPKGGTRTPPLAIPLPVDNHRKGGTEAPPIAEKGGTEAPPIAEKGGTESAQRRYAGTAPPLNPLTTGVPVVGGAVEVARDALGQKQHRGVDVAGELAGVRRRKMSSIEYAAWQAAESRRIRLEAEQEIRKHQQGEEKDHELPHHV